MPGRLGLVRKLADDAGGAAVRQPVHVVRVGGVVAEFDYRCPGRHFPAAADAIRRRPERGGVVAGRRLVPPEPPASLDILAVERPFAGIDGLEVQRTLWRPILYSSSIVK